MPNTYEVVFVGTRKIENVKSLITNKIVFVPIIHTMEKVNALVFTSAYAIRSLIESALHNPCLLHWKNIPSFVISPASAQILYDEGAVVEFVGKKAHGEAFAREICPLLQERKVLYLRAKEIVSGLDAILKDNHIDFDEVIAYENIPQSLPLKLKPKPKSVIIFSAPSAYHSFVKNFGWESQYVAVAIGQSTLSHFDKHMRAYVSPSPNFTTCIEFAQNLALNLQ